MKTFYTVVIAILALLATSMPAMAQGVDSLSTTKPSEDSGHSGFSLNAALLDGVMHSEYVYGGYLYASIGKSGIGLDVLMNLFSSTDGAPFRTELPLPYLNRVSLMFEREVYGLGNKVGTIMLSFAAGPAYTFGIARGQYLSSVNEGTGPVAMMYGSDYYQSVPISRLGLSLGADIDEVFGPMLMGFRLSLTIDKVESYGYFGTKFGYIFN